MSRGEKPRTSLERLAAEAIGFEGQGTSADRLTDVFRKLQDDDFLPDPMAHEAMLALAGRPLPLDKSRSVLFQKASHLRDCRLHAEVEQFAADFFAIPTVQRVDRWKALIESASPRIGLIQRLESLKPGLAIEPETLSDSIPAVKCLIDDILTLFTFSHSSRGHETRARADRFLTDPSLSVVDRSKALKYLNKRHPEIAALAPGFLDQLSPRPRQPTRRQSVRDGAAEPRAEPVSDETGNKRAFVAIAIVILAAVSRLLTSHSTTGRFDPSSTVEVPASASPGGRTPPLPTLTSTSITPPHRIVRDELKQKIREELDKLDQSLDEPQLDRIVAGLPIEVVSDDGGMGTVRLLGAWTDKFEARFVEALRNSLLDTNLKLTRQEVDELVTNCLPKPATESPADRPTWP